MEKNQTITDVHQKGEQVAEDITQRTHPAKKNRNPTEKMGNKKTTTILFNSKF